MSTNEEEDDTTAIVVPSSMGLCITAGLLPGDALWQDKVHSIDMLACADTVEDILPHNHVTRYLKYKYETESLRDDGEGDENTLNTLNTTNNTLNTLDMTGQIPGDEETIEDGSTLITLNTIGNTLNTLNMTGNTVDRSEYEGETVDQTTEIPYDEACDQGIEVEIAKVPSNLDWQEDSYVVPKPEFPEILGDLVVKTSKSFDPQSDSSPSRDVNRSRTEGAIGLGTTINASTLDPATNLKFAPWLGEDAVQHQHESRGPPPIPSPSPSSDYDDATDLVSKTSGTTKTSRTTKEADTSFLSKNTTATEKSVEVIGRGIKVEPKKKPFKIGSISNRKKDSEEDDKFAKGGREHRWEEMKVILQATAEAHAIEKGGKKKGKWKKAMKGAMGSLRIKKKKPGTRTKEVKAMDEESC
jgi:hypothetical protein